MGSLAIKMASQGWRTAWISMLDPPDRLQPIREAGVYYIGGLGISEGEFFQLARFRCQGAQLVLVDGLDRVRVEDGLGTEVNPASVLSILVNAARFREYAAVATCQVEIDVQTVLL